MGQLTAQTAPHTPGVPAPPQVRKPAHVPHDRVALHPSESAPHVLAWAAHVVGTHAPLPQTFGVPPPPQVCVPRQPPHCTVPPHPSSIAPQVFPALAQVFGKHPPSPPQLPQAIVPPQPSSTAPQAPPHVVRHPLGVSWQTPHFPCASQHPPRHVCTVHQGASSGTAPHPQSAPTTTDSTLNRIAAPRLKS